MNKDQALYAFWSSFGIPAYEENSVPDDATFPYITYQSVTDSFGGGDVSMVASIYDRSMSWETVSLMTDKIGAQISMGGKLIPYDGGALWLKRGAPFSQNMGDAKDDAIRRKLLNITAEYISAN